MTNENYIMMRVKEETYNTIKKWLEKEHENAVEMSQRPNQMWKEAWKDEARKFEKMLKEIESNPFEQNDRPF